MFLKVLALKLTMGEAEMCFLNIFLFAQKAKQPRNQVNFCLFLSFSWMYTLDLVLNVN